MAKSRTSKSVKRGKIEAFVNNENQDWSPQDKFYGVLAIIAGLLIVYCVFSYVAWVRTPNSEGGMGYTTWPFPDHK